MIAKRLLLNLFKQYNIQTEKRPFVMITVSTGVILGCGDLLMQTIENYMKKKQDLSKKITVSYDFYRTLNMAKYGWFVFGPFCYCWYTKWLPSFVHFPQGVVPAGKKLFFKIFLDETLGSWFYILTFLYTMTRLEGGNHESGMKKVKKDFLLCYEGDLCVWPIVQYLNFKYVPNHLQSLVVSGFSILFAAFLSFVQHRHLLLNQGNAAAVQNIKIESEQNQLTATKAQNPKV